MPRREPREHSTRRAAPDDEHADRPNWRGNHEAQHESTFHDVGVHDDAPGARHRTLPSSKSTIAAEPEGPDDARLHRRKNTRGARPEEIWPFEFFCVQTDGMTQGG